MLISGEGSPPVLGINYPWRLPYILNDFAGDPGAVKDRHLKIRPGSCGNDKVFSIKNKTRTTSAI